jgi:hypothetical protein
MRREKEWFAAERLRKGTPWIRDLIKNGLLDGECWGFVVFRTGCYGTEQDEESWRRFREYFDTAAKATILHYNSGPLLWPKFRAIFVEREGLDGASAEQLRTEFKRMRDGDTAADEQLPKGIRTSFFLVVDKAAIESEGVKLGWVTRDPLEPPLDWQLQFGPVKDDLPVYVRAIHPDFESNKEGAEAQAGDGSSSSGSEIGRENSMEGFTGEVTLALPRVFDWLNMLRFESERGTSWESWPIGKGWSEIFDETKDPEVWIRAVAPHSGLVHHKPGGYKRKVQM